MARQVINTDPPIGDPAPTAFNKINAMTAELYPLAIGAMPKTGGTFTGAVSITGAGLNAGGVVTASSSLVSAANGVLSQGAGSGYQFFDRLDYAQTWAVFASGAECQIWNSVNGPAMRISRAGICTAVAFNPTSSADVKANVEGYQGDADNELDRLVVISFQYKEDFCEDVRVRVGLLAENINSVKPTATGGDYDEIVQVPRVVQVQKQILLPPVVVVDEEGNEHLDETPRYEMVTVEETVYDQHMRHVPMNYDMSQVLALSVRAHQQKSKRIRDLEAANAAALQRSQELESTVAAALQRIEALESAA